MLSKEEGSMTWVFISRSTCGHAQSVYVDKPQDDGGTWDSSIMGDLRAGLTVERIPIEEYRRRYVKRFMCGCRTVGHENETKMCLVAE